METSGGHDSLIPLFLVTLTTVPVVSVQTSEVDAEHNNNHSIR